MTRTLNNVVIVGGGSAGWLTALTCQKYLPDSNIILVESEEIGILGAGEGSTPSLIATIQDLGIDYTDLLYHSAGTLKNGIKFTNWNSPEGEYYYHNFFSIDKDFQDVEGYGVKNNFKRYNTHSVLETVLNEDKKYIDLVAHANETNNTLLLENNGIFPDIQNRYSNLASFGIHFNAVKFADYLRRVGESRGIQRVEGKVTEILSKNNGDISGFMLENGTQVDADFVFDCTGFHRLIIGKHFKSEWKPYTDYISTTNAAPFFLPIDLNEDIPPYTEAIAMKYGWVWKIPTVDRYGCGYVFDPNYTNLDEVKVELEEYFNQKIEIPRVFQFEPGTYDKHWVNNCIAIGLSSGFIEPLEATSIYTSLHSLQEILYKPYSLNEVTDVHSDLYNKEINEWNADVMNFIYFHYMGQRNDTPFWEKFKDINNAPQYIQDTISKWEHTPIRFRDYKLVQPFGAFSYFQVGTGINKISSTLFKKIYDSLGLHNKKKDYLEFKASQQKRGTALVKHKTYIKNLRARYEN